MLVPHGHGAYLRNGEGLAELGEVPNLSVLMNHVLHQYYLVLFLLIEYSLHVVGLVLDPERALDPLFDLALTHHVVVVVEPTRLLPALLILLHLLLPELHLRLELLLHPHLPHGILLQVLLPLPGDLIVQVLNLLLDELPRLDLATAVPVQSLPLLVNVVRLLVRHLPLVGLTLALQRRSLVLQKLQPVSLMLGHLLLMLAHFIQELYLIVEIDSTLVPMPSIGIVLFKATYATRR